MTKVIGMLVALAMFAAMPAVAFAGSSSDGDNVSSGNTQDGTIDQGAAGGDSSASGGDGGSGSDDGDGGSGGDAGSGDGGDAGNQAAICQQNAGEDANCSIDQSQSFGGGDDGDGDSSDDDGSDDDSDDDSSDDDDVTSGGTGGGVDSVTLAQTGFDAWVLALIGGLSLAGGLSLLVAQRRGRLNA